MSTSDTELTQDDVFEILSSPRRRYLLYYLRQRQEPVELTALAEHVAAWENGVDTDDLTTQERKRVYVSLYQTHVPKLDEAGIVEYDPESGMVVLTQRAQRIDSYLGEDDQMRWQLFYVALAAAGSVLLLVTLADVWVFEALTEAVVATVVVGLFGLLAVSHVVYQRRSRQSIPPELSEGGSERE
jgi:DNA-binding transcriptional ArsR family regulator